MFKIFSLSLLDVTIYDILILILFMLALLLTIIFCLILVSTQIRHLLCTSKENHDILLASTIAKPQIADIDNDNKPENQEKLAIADKQTLFEPNYEKINNKTESNPLLLEDYTTDNKNSASLLVDTNKYLPPLFPVVDKKTWKKNDNQITNLSSEKDMSSTEHHKSELTLLPTVYEEPQKNIQNIILEDKKNKNSDLEDTLKVIASSLQNISNTINANFEYKSNHPANTKNLTSEDLTPLNFINYQDFQNSNEDSEEDIQHDNEQEANLQNVFLTNDFGISPPSYILKQNKNFISFDKNNTSPDHINTTSTEKVVSDGSNSEKNTSNNHINIPSIYKKYDVNNIDDLTNKYLHNKSISENKVRVFLAEDNLPNDTLVEKLHSHNNLKAFSDRKIHDTNKTDTRVNNFYIKHNKFDDLKIKSVDKKTSLPIQQRKVKTPISSGSLVSNFKFHDQTLNKYNKLDMFNNRNLQNTKYSKFRKYDVKHNEVVYRENKNIFSNLQNEANDVSKQYRTSTSRLRRNTR